MSVKVQETHFVSEEPSISIGRVALGIPLYGSLHSVNVMYMLNHLAYGIASRVYGTLALIEGAYVDHARNTVVRNTLFASESDESDIPPLTHLFFHDQDVMVPEGTVEKLLSHDLPVVGAVYFGRDDQHLPIAFNVEPFRRLKDYDPTGIQQVDGIGMGATLINLDVFRMMKSQYEDEWYYRCTEIVEGDGRRTGEDIWFAWRCRELGIPIYLDGSVPCGHTAIVPITARHYQEAKEYRMRIFWLDPEGRFAFGGDEARMDTADMVIDVHAENPAPPQAIHYVHAFEDAGLPDMDPLWDLARTARLALDDGQSVLVRCQGGSNRSALVCALVLSLQGLDGPRIIKTIRSAREDTLHNMNFYNYVQQLTGSEA